MATKGISTGTAPSHDPKKMHQGVDLSARNTRDNTVRSTRVDNTPKYDMRWSDSTPGNKAFKTTSGEGGGTRFSTHFKTSELKSGTGIKDVLATTAKSSAQVAGATQSGLATQQVYQSAMATARIVSKVPGVTSTVYHKIRGNAYTPLKANTSTDAFAKFEAGTQVGGDHGLYANFRNYRSSATLHTYERNKGFEYFHNTKKLKMDNGQYAVFNRKTGRMEVMESVKLRNSESALDFVKKSWQKSKNGLKTQSVKWGLDAAPPESFFDGDHAAFIKNRNAVLRHNAKTVGIKTGTKVVRGLAGTAKAGETFSKLASGEMNGEEFAKKAVKAEAKIATKPVRRVVNSRIKTYQKKIWDKTGGRVTKWAGNKFWNSKLGKKITKIKGKIGRSRDNAIEGIKNLAKGLFKAFLGKMKSIIAIVAPVIAPVFLVMVLIIPLIGAIGGSEESCSGGAGTYTIPLEKTGPTSTFTFTCYDYWYGSGKEMVWASGTAQRTIADKWKEKGSVFEGGVAKIGKCYLVACTNKYGVVGDKIKVTLENGEFFKCIIADIKSSSDSNYSEWGHKNGGSTNIIEFEVQRSYALNKGYGNVALWNPQWNWNSNVVKIENLGENDDNTAGCSSAGLTGEGANWRPNASNQQAWSDSRYNAYANCGLGAIYGGYFNGQCTWYAAGYIVEVYGIPSGMHGNGSSCVNELVAANPEYFTKSNTPVSGAIYSVPGYSKIGTSQFGHVGIVLNYNESTQECTIFDGNWSGTCESGGNYKVWVVSLSYLKSSNATFANPTQKGVELAKKKSSTSNSNSGGSSGKLSDK